jgi:hypothetical protein
VARIDDSTSVAYFGYLSDFAFPVEIPVGPLNRFDTGSDDRGQPIVFLPGRSRPYPNPAFGVVFHSDHLVWTLDGYTASASRSMQTCDQLTATP